MKFGLKTHIMMTYHFSYLVLSIKTTVYYHGVFLSEEGGMFSTNLSPFPPYIQKVSQLEKGRGRKVYPMGGTYFTRVDSICF